MHNYISQRMSQFLSAGKVVWDLCAFAITANVGMAWELEEVVINEKVAEINLFQLLL